jgi:hypothetical protein
MFVRYPAPPGSAPRSVKVTQGGRAGDVIVTAGPPVPRAPGTAWPRSAHAEGAHAAVGAPLPARDTGG